MARFTCICDKCRNEFTTDNEYGTSTCPSCESIQNDYDRNQTKIRQKYSDIEYERDRELREKYNLDN